MSGNLPPSFADLFATSPILRFGSTELALDRTLRRETSNDESLWSSSLLSLSNCGGGVDALRFRDVGLGGCRVVDFFGGTVLCDGLNLSAGGAGRAGFVETLLATLLTGTDRPILVVTFVVTFVVACVETLVVTVLMSGFFAGKAAPKKLMVAEECLLCTDEG